MAVQKQLPDIKSDVVGPMQWKTSTYNCVEKCRGENERTLQLTSYSYLIPKLHCGDLSVQLHKMENK